MELTYKPAEQRDVQIIFDLSRDLIDRYEDVASIDYDRVLNWMHRKIEENIGQYMCVFADGRKAAYYRFCRNGQMMELDDLYVLPEFRSRGIGTKILKKCCAETVDPVMLYCFIRNSGALSLYRRMGFQVTQKVGNTRCIMVRKPLEGL